VQRSLILHAAIESSVRVGGAFQFDEVAFRVLQVRGRAVAFSALVVLKAVGLNAVRSPYCDSGHRSTDSNHHQLL
jgi:hypothetical protein